MARHGGHLRREQGFDLVGTQGGDVFVCQCSHLRVGELRHLLGTECLDLEGF